VCVCVCGGRFFGAMNARARSLVCRRVVNRGLHENAGAAVHPRVSHSRGDSTYALKIPRCQTRLCADSFRAVWRVTLSLSLSLSLSPPSTRGRQQGSSSNSSKITRRPPGSIGRRSTIAAAGTAAAALGVGVRREERRGRVNTEPEQQGVTGHHRREVIRRLRDREHHSRWESQPNPRILWPPFCS